MKTFYVRADIQEEMPTYDFVVKANTRKQAEKIAKKIIATDYQDFTDYPFSCEEVTAQELLETMTIN